MLLPRIPRIVHFVYGLHPQEAPFPLAHHLAVASAIEVLQPDRVLIHLDELPYGVYWDLLRPRVEVMRVSRVPEIDARPADDPLVQRNRYAHHADVIRLDALIEHGGVYLDIDTLTVRSFPDAWLDESFVIGEEPRYPGLPPTLLNAVMAAEPGAAFAREWRERIVEEMDGTWSAHSCELAARIADEHRALVRVLPVEAFCSIGSTPEHLEGLLSRTVSEAAADPLDMVHPRAHVLHLSEHLWWDEQRTDFLRFSGSNITERWVRTADTPYALLARRHLPRHELFR